VNAFTNIPGQAFFNFLNHFKDNNQKEASGEVPPRCALRKRLGRMKIWHRRRFHQ